MDLFLENDIKTCKLALLVFCDLSGVVQEENPERQMESADVVACHPKAASCIRIPITCPRDTAGGDAIVEV